MHNREEKLFWRKGAERMGRSFFRDPRPRYGRGNDFYPRRAQQSTADGGRSYAEVLKRGLEQADFNRDSRRKREVFFAEHARENDSDEMSREQYERNDRSWSREDEEQGGWQIWRPRRARRAFTRTNGRPHSNGRTESYTRDPREYSSARPSREQRYGDGERDWQRRPDNRRWRSEQRGRGDRAPRRAAARNESRDWNAPYGERRVKWRSPARRWERDGDYDRRMPSERNRGERDRSFEDRREGAYTRRNPRARNPPADVRDRGTDQQVTDPDFTRQVRIAHKLIKSVHHLQNVADTDNPPTNITKMTDSLMTFIKPASPTEHTTLLIESNAKNWGFTSTMILRDHYRAMIDAHTQEFVNIADENWREPFEVATRWARRGLGRRLKTDTLEHVEALLITALSSDTTDDHSDELTDESEPPQQIREREMRPRPSVCDTQANKPVTKIKKTTLIATAETNTKRVATTAGPPRPSQIAGALAALDQRRPRAHQRTVTAQVHTQSRPILQTPPPPTNTEEESSSGQEQVEEEEDEEEVLDSEEMVSPTPQTTLQQDPPLIQFNTDLEVQPETPLNSTPRGPPSRVTTPGSETSVLDLTMEELERWLDPPDRERILGVWMPNTQQRVFLTPRRVTRATQGRTAVTTGSGAGTPPEVTTHTCQVTRHINTVNKFQDWRYKVTGKCIILGDSNVSKFTVCDIDDLQIDSFPGATFEHATHLLAQVPVANEVHTAILALGLNCRGRNPHTTTIPQLKKTIRTAELKFPQAKIWLPCINYARSLPPQEQSNIDLLNRYVKENCSFIPELSRSQFSTGTDRIHWTEGTADRILTHWLTHVKETSP